MLFSQWIGALGISRSFYQLYNYSGYGAARTPALCLLQYVKDGLEANFLEQIPQDTQIEDILSAIHNTFVVSRVAYQNDDLPLEFAVQMANQFKSYLDRLSILASAEELMDTAWGDVVVRYLGYGYSNLGLWLLYEANEHMNVSHDLIARFQSIKRIADTAAYYKATFAKFQNPPTTYQRQDVTIWLQTWTDLCIAHVDPSVELKSLREYWNIINKNTQTSSRTGPMRVLTEHLYDQTLTKENWKADSLVGMSTEPALMPGDNSALNDVFVSLQNGFKSVLNQHWPKSRRIGFPLLLGDLLGIIGGDDFKFPEEDLTNIGTWNAVDAAIHLNVDKELVKDYIRSADNVLNPLDESINDKLIELLSQNSELSSRELAEVLFTIFPVPALVLREDPRFNYVADLAIGPIIQNQVNFAICQTKLDLMKQMSSE